MNARNISIIVVLLISSVVAKAQYSIQCEDTCNHVHGLDMSHYQGNVFWEAVGDNGRMFYVYLKATEGETFIDKRYEENIYMARKNGLKGHTISTDPNSLRKSNSGTSGLSVVHKTKT